MRLNNTNLNFENEEGTIDYKEKKILRRTRTVGETFSS